MLDHHQEPQRHLAERLHRLQDAGPGFMPTGDILEQIEASENGPVFQALRQVLGALEEEVRRDLVVLVEEMLAELPRTSDLVTGGWVLQINRGESSRAATRAYLLRGLLTSLGGQLLNKGKKMEAERPTIWQDHARRLAAFAEAAVGMSDEQLLIEREQRFWGITPPAKEAQGQ